MFHKAKESDADSAPWSLINGSFQIINLMIPMESACPKNQLFHEQSLSATSCFLTSRFTAGKPQLTLRPGRRGWRAYGKGNKSREVTYLFISDPLSGRIEITLALVRFLASETTPKSLNANIRYSSVSSLSSNTLIPCRS